MTDVDTFADDVRRMLERRAADIPDLLGPASGLTGGATSADVIVVEGASQRSPQPSRSPGWLAAVAAAVLVVGMGVGFVVGRGSGGGGGDGGVDVAAIDLTTSTTASSTIVAEAVPEDAGADAASLNSFGWPLSTPSLDQLPAGALDGLFVFRAPGSIDEVALAYLTDRLPDQTAPAVSVEIVETDPQDRYGLLRWSWDDPQSENGEAGWLYLVFADGAWSVLTATTDGVDLSTVALDADGLHGTIFNDGPHQLGVEFFDVSTGERLEPLSGRPVADDLVPSQKVWFDGPAELEVATPLLQLVLRVMTYDGTLRSVSEVVLEPSVIEPEAYIFVEPDAVDAVAAALDGDPSVSSFRVLSAADTRGIYTRFATVERLARVWDDGAGYVAFVVAASDVRSFESLDGVIAAVRIEESAPPAGSRPPVEGGPLVIDAIEVDYVPEAITCEVPLGVPPQPNEIVTVESPISASSPEEALVLAITGAPEAPPWASGYTEYIQADGTISYGYADPPGRILGVVHVAETPEGWAVTGWEVVGC